MANKKRAANREKATKLAHREEGHTEAGFKGSTGTPSRSSGSPAHHAETVGPGPIPGAGESWAPGPGPASRGVGMTGYDAATAKDKTPSGKPPKGMKTEYEGE